MSQSTSYATTVAVTPSEAVLLHGDRFAKSDTILTTGETLLLNGAKVAAEDLSRAALAAAVLANERAGAIRLEVRTEKHLFGLIKTRRIYAETADAAPAWPRGSLEAVLLACRAETGARKVADILYHVMEEDSPAPARQVLHLIKRGLIGRGLLKTQETKVLKVFKGTRHIPSESLRDADTEASAGLAEELIAPWRDGRPDEWERLGKAISEALSRRKEVDHDWND